MASFVTLLQQGNSWLFVPSAILLGALHGLEPGHSKTMMAAFIVAIRGTVAQAALLGLSATVSHTAIVWLIALGGLYFGREWNTESTEPYFQVASAVLIVAVAAWMLWRTRQVVAGERAHTHAHDSHDHSHGHDRPHGHERPHGGDRAHEEVPEPHEFIARLRLGEHQHSHDFDVEFVEHAHHHAIAGYAPLDLTAPGYQDPHELAHANDIRRRFGNRSVTTGQIVLFGLTGGLIPCPASITVLLLCLQLRRLVLGATLVLCFSIGLALTMVATGALAAFSVQHAARRFRGFGELARRAPYVSGCLILLVGAYIGWQGLRGLHALP